MNSSSSLTLARLFYCSVYFSIRHLINGRGAFLQCSIKDVITETRRKIFGPLNPCKSASAVRCPNRKNSFLSATFSIWYKRYCYILINKGKQFPFWATIIDGWFPNKLYFDVFVVTFFFHSFKF